eukprot:TRINITY_DN9552_c0_g1_i4.p1 TRINITY_DN9552_c0_g1~~TRINITY_DN9552_c0_g1_i4.p1  ORF type:complete len:161 (-),score=5.22 TRINITY_DN9552_c0_g1_i4:339-821(-)
MSLQNLSIGSPFVAPSGQNLNQAWRPPSLVGIPHEVNNRIAPFQENKIMPVASQCKDPIVLGSSIILNPIQRTLSSGCQGRNQPIIKKSEVDTDSLKFSSANNLTHSSVEFIQSPHKLESKSHYPPNSCWISGLCESNINSSSPTVQYIPTGEPRTISFI